MTFSIAPSPGFRIDGDIVTQIAPNAPTFKFERTPSSRDYFGKSIFLKPHKTNRAARRRAAAIKRKRS